MSGESSKKAERSKKSGELSTISPGMLRLTFRRKTVFISTALIITITAVAVVALSLGDLPLSVPEIVSAFAGQQSSIVETVVLHWRLPRVLGAIIFGAALGVSGAIFQSLTRNPLATPDLIGLTAGSYTGGLIVIILLGGGAVPVAAGALIGGLVAAALVYLLAYRQGIQGFRLIIVGIGISAILGAISSYLIVRARLEVAITAAIWGEGSLNSVGWHQVLPSLTIIVVVFFVLAALVPSMRQLELGDDSARALGVRAEPARLGLVICAVALTAVVTAAAGPIAFVSLAAPQIARRLTRSAGITLAPSALLGALMLTVSDIVAQHAFAVSLPVGVVTVVLGGAYLVGLLIHETRKRP